MWILRNKFNKIAQVSDHFPILILTGARQVGKSSLIKKVFADCDYVSLDLPGDIEFAEKNPDEFFKRYKTPLIIDEVQNTPSLFKWIKHKVDASKSKKLLYILIGPQKFVLIKNVQESLAGRALILDLLPLSLNEIVNSNPKYRYEYQELIIRGGHPALYKNPEISPTDYFRSYLQTYLERDVKDILNVLSLRDFERFLRIMANRTANLVNKAEVAKDVGVSPTTINQWISVLQSSNQIHLLEPLYNNKSKSIIKTPKVYFYDTGLLCFLLNIRDYKTLIEGPFKGAIWENFVFSELYKTLDLLEIEKALSFWRDRGKEIDFVVNQGGLIDFFEAKWETEPDYKSISNMVDYEKKYMSSMEKIRSINIVCPTENPGPRTLGKDRVGLNLKSPFDFNFS